MLQDVTATVHYSAVKAKQLRSLCSFEFSISDEVKPRLKMKSIVLAENVTKLMNEMAVVFVYAMIVRR